MMNEPITRAGRDALAQDVFEHPEQYQSLQASRYPSRPERSAYPRAVALTLTFSDVFSWQCDTGNTHPVEAAARRALPAHDTYLADLRQEIGLLLCRCYNAETKLWEIDAAYSVPEDALRDPPVDGLVLLTRCPAPCPEQLNAYGFLIRDQGLGARG